MADGFVLRIMPDYQQDFGTFAALSIYLEPASQHVDKLRMIRKSRPSRDLRQLDWM